MRALVGALLAEQHDEWAVARRYMSAESITKALSPPPDQHEEVMAIEAAAWPSARMAAQRRTPLDGTWPRSEALERSEVGVDVA